MRPSTSRSVLRRAAPALAALLLVPACNSGSRPAATTRPAANTTTTGPPLSAAAVVDIRYLSFHPKSVIITAGQTVEWTFADGGIAHNVVGGGWRSTDRTNGSYTHTFLRSGTYKYQCTLHAGMTGDVVVTP